VRVEVLKMNELSAPLIARWRQLQAKTPMFGSPLVGPDFARLISIYRPDAQVAVGYQGDDAVAFFAFHNASRGYVRPIGAPFCDYQAIVTEPGVAISGDEFLAKAGIACLSFTSLMDPHGLFSNDVFNVVEGYRIDCADGGAAHLQALFAKSPKWTKNLRRLSNKIDRELGPLKLVAHDTNPSAFAALKAIKIAQFKETGILNVLGPAWVNDFMQELFDNQSGDFGGCLVSLYAGGQFVAGQFGVRQGDWFHPWIASTCPRCHPYSPGILFLSELVRHSDANGLRVIDLSEGHGHYKSQFCRDPVLVSAGVVGASKNLAPASSSGALGLIKKRLDLISALEPTILGQITSLGTTIAGIPARLKARQDQNARSQSDPSIG
jgi:CelD/BcsL family acetyltransferase involved in cellulose biosynthesis